MRVAITGEGKTDFGSRDGYGEWQWGPVARYVEMVMKNKPSLSLIPIDRKDVEGVRLSRSARDLNGKGITSRKFIILANEKNVDLGIYYCDADRSNGSKNSRESVARKRYEEVHKEISDGLKTGNVPAIPMIALRMIECWLLGDKKAIEKAFHVKIDDKDMPKKPELTWGNEKDGNSGHPKRFIQRILKKYTYSDPSMESFCRIAEESDLETLRKSCSISFEEFYLEMKEMIGELI